MLVDVWLGDHNSMGYSCFVQCLLFGGFLPGGGFLANIYTPWMGYYFFREVGFSSFFCGRKNPRFWPKSR